MLPNYLWLSIVDRNSLNYTSTLRESDCFDILILSFSYTNNTASPSFSIDIRWFDESSNFLTQDSFTCLTGNGTVAANLPVKGAFVQIAFQDALGSLFLWSLTAILANV